MIYIEMVKKMMKANKKFFINLGTMYSVIIGIFMVMNSFHSPGSYNIFFFLRQFVTVAIALSYLFLTGVSFPFVELWMEKNTLFRMYLGKKTILEHFNDIRSGRREIDAITGDNVRYKVSGYVDRYGDINNANLKEHRSRETANNRKETMLWGYILRYTLIKIPIMMFVWFICPILALIAIPSLQKSGLEAWLDERLANNN